MEKEEVFRDRVRPVVSRIPEQEIDAFWVSGLVNIRYLTGFTGSFAQLLLAPAESVFITDGRYKEQSQSEVVGCRLNVFESQKWIDVLAAEIGRQGWRRIGFESAHVTFETYGKLRTHPDLADTVEWKPTSSWIEARRVVKDEIELEALRRSSRVVDAVFGSLLSEFREGVSERQILRRLMNLLWEHGATGPSFEPIVLFGSRTSLPHGRPSEVELRGGDWVLLDFGAVVDGYCSDCTRAFVYGEPDDRQKTRHELVLRANEAGKQAAVPGATCKEVDAAARRVIAEGGLGEAFIHGLGHGIGLEIHEAPRLAATSEEVLREGMVVTIEPGVYVPGWGGIRIEDAVVVSAGGAETLTHCDRTIRPVS